MLHFQVRLLVKFYPHKFCLALKPDVFAVCIEKYRFLVFINDKRKTGLNSANKTPLTSEVTVINQLKVIVHFNYFWNFRVFSG
jgi:hypothetical protein